MTEGPSFHRNAKSPGITLPGLKNENPRRVTPQAIETSYSICTDLRLGI
jgi:hypothetical protein